ncbi:hypothetical protein F4553_000398 [Allocatelliglobosispora scoriae]|uniref:HEAT repeat domain-containing protein n=1 Tax=Allocatelliglobosispora scoriae TaxID=643052 RepID=A0A841BIM4_9ACTN|nr:hypothetical protein [Allocatelliglobosispora scoriae]MBB5867019.1 hypothetical protein [Allocatelliglobosispora scoriae]
MPEEIRPQIVDLIIAALQRTYRCKDWLFARLVRHVADEQFTDRIEALSDADDPVVRLRAQFILHVARHPEQRVRYVSWRRWLASAAGT